MSVNTWYNCITPSDLDQLITATQYNSGAPSEWIHPNDEDDDYERPEPSLWTERTWLGLHSLLTFGEWAEQPLLGASIAGGTPIGRDYCYEDSPVRYFTVDQVHDIALALGQVTEEALRASYDPAALKAAKMPPLDGWEQDSFVHLWKTFSDIQGFFQMARVQRYAVLVYLC